MKSTDDMPNTCIFQEEAKKKLLAKLADIKEEVCEKCGGPIK